MTESDICISRNTFLPYYFGVALLGQKNIIFSWGCGWAIVWNAIIFNVNLTSIKYTCSILTSLQTLSAIANSTDRFKLSFPYLFGFNFRVLILSIRHLFWALFLFSWKRGLWFSWMLHEVMELNTWTGTPELPNAAELVTFWARKWMIYRSMMKMAILQMMQLKRKRIAKA